jgi:WhiB family transcriptional regulator, redox-sensing transcriptional regulator
MTSPTRRHHDIGPGASPMHADPRAACANLTFEAVDRMFYPASYDSPHVDEAKTICRRCPLAGDCLAWALDTGQPDGIWGATTPAERRAILARPHAHLGKAAA